MLVILGLTDTVNVKRSVHWRLACRNPIWPRLAKYRATARARCVQLAFWLFGTLLFAPTACTPGYKNRSNNAEPFQKDLLSSA